MAPEILHLSTVVGSPLLDRDGERLGKVGDLIVRLGEGDYPPVSGLLAKIGRRDLFVPIDLVADIRPGEVRLAGHTLNLGRFERRPNELLLTKDIAGRHLINLVGARLVKAKDIELASLDGSWRVVGVDPGTRSTLRRLLPGHLGGTVKPGTILDWSSIEPFVSHVPTAQLRIPYRKLARLHPAQIADLVEEASHDEGEEIIEAVGQDSALEADVFEELDPPHQIEFLAERSDTEVAAVLANMDPDDAADLIADLDQERRQPVLDLLPPSRQRKVRALLRYNKDTAGGLMNPDFVCVPETATVREVLAEIRANPGLPETLSVVYTMDGRHQVSGSVPMIRLLRADTATPLSQLRDPDPVVLAADADLHEVVRKVTDYNLTAVPVVDDKGHMIGVVTVDDVLEELMPTGWRKEFGMAAAE